MTFPQLSHFTKYWESYPPIHVLIAGYMGIKPKTEESKEEINNDAQLAAFIQESAMLSGTVMAPDVLGTE